MKKNGRKYRKLQQEKAEWKKNHPQKAGEPFSKVRKEQRDLSECRHYLSWKASIGLYSPIPRPCFSPNFFLRKISNTECKCIVCGKRYPIEKIEEVKEEMTQEILGKTISTT